MNSNQLREFSTNLIKHIVKTSPENNLKGFDEPAWDEPIVGFASGSDPLFRKYKDIIGDFFWSPAEVMELKYGENFDISDLSIIVWILPQTDKTLADQRVEKELPSSRWVHSRHYGEFFNEFLRAEAERSFEAIGIKAAAAAIRPEFAYQKSESAGLASNWSERHAAFAAGLGTFGLSDGFITERGKAVRIGSVVINAKIEPDKRTAKKHTDNCLYYANGTCGVCMKRCPADAITKSGHDKQVCHDYIRGITAPYAYEILGAKQTPCGLCQVKIPCERRNPINQS
jgi:epoxyqueuosine reductase QueG